MWSEEVKNKCFDYTKEPCNYYVPRGWVPLVEDLVKELNSVPAEYKILQIKQKFGYLRVYIDNWSSDDLSDIITKYESRSARICSSCGRDGEIRSNMYINVLCDSCFEEVNNPKPKEI